MIEQAETVSNEEQKDVEVTLDENNKPTGIDTAKDTVDTKSDTDINVQSESDEKPDEELQEYSKNVKNRIDKVTKKFYKEEQARKEAERKAEEASLENKKLKERLENLDKGYISEYGTRLDAQLDQAKKNYREAHEAGDVDKMFDAQSALSKISIEQERHRIAKERQDTMAESKAQPQAQPQAQQEPPVDPKAKAWAEDNEWFGSDVVMTNTAMGIHQKLEQEGFDLQSDEYYDEVNRQLKGLFPDKFKTGRANGGGVKVASADTSASRTKPGRRTVRLSPSQVAIARKLGVPLEEYAKHVKE
tara:strand:- start:6156 stop:7064 length:909 start_codon:yes stop_codon:yes gene_type:complete